MEEDGEMVEEEEVEIKRPLLSVARADGTWVKTLVKRTKKAKPFSLQIWQAPRLKTSGYVPFFWTFARRRKRRRDGECFVYSIRL